MLIVIVIVIGGGVVSARPEKAHLAIELVEIVVWAGHVQELQHCKLDMSQDTNME